ADDHDGWINGFTDNYCKVRVPFDPSLVNSVQSVELGKITFDLEMNGVIQEPVKA
ncbi:MAG: hypothetical protein HKN32_04745, partial [Flavobacteriales bacterium]|nr:hypothetical protein [Flavobacteriales bacterium]